MPTIPNSMGFTPRPYQSSSAVPAAFGDGGRGLAEGGKDLISMGQQIAEHAQRVQTREDVVARAGAQSAFFEAAHREMTRLSTEADWADLKTFDGYGQFLTDTMEQAVAKAGGSPDSQAMLRARLTDVRASLVNQAAQQSVAAGQKRVTGLIDHSLSGLTAKVMADPATLGDHAQAWDKTIDDFAPALTPDQEASYRLEGRRALVGATLNQLADRPGGAGEVSKLIKANPQYVEMLSPDQQAGLYRKINAAAEAERQARAAAAAPLNKFRALMHRDPTLGELYQFAGIGDTPMAKLQQYEEAGIKLSPEQQMQVLGIKPAQGLTAQTDAGKAVADRLLFVQQFGEGSPQVKAYDDASAGGGGSDIAGMRKEHTALSTEYLKVQRAYSTLQALKATPSATSDVALIISVMKVMDPGSVVQQGEQETASKTAGITDQVWTAYNKALTGVKLTPEQRVDFVQTAGKYYQSSLEQQQRIDAQFRSMATRAGYRPEDVVVDFIGQPAAPASSPSPASSATGVAASSSPVPAASEAAVAQPMATIRLDLNGNVITE